MTLDVPPRADELEISLFGPGVGECVVAHIGGGEWLVVDSCLNPESREPAALEYLSRIGVRVESDVRYVVVSHWHDDHTRGVSRVLEASKSATFVCSTALRKNEFKTLIAMSRELNLKDSTTGLDELNQSLRCIEERREAGRRKVDVGPKFVHADSVIYRRDANETLADCEVVALSPSDSALTRSHHDIGALLREKAAKRAIVNVTPNETALVIGLRFGQAVAILGSDLEAGSSPNDGWGAVLTTTTRPKQGQIFKVPHHGSENAHHDGQWTTLMAPSPLAIVTPYASGKNPLPSKADVTRLKQLARRVCVTSPPPRKVSFNDRMVERTLNEVAKVVRSRSSRLGHVRVRISSRKSSPNVELFGAAFAA
ncbi:MAG: MBL fold metallo-hydrolase [Polyangiaceae bacterium]|nr:MBL fold metallo-hydrolase [Polyangiaceae bacterium]